MTMDVYAPDTSLVLTNVVLTHPSSPERSFVVARMAIVWGRMTAVCGLPTWAHTSFIAELEAGLMSHGDETRGTPSMRSWSITSDTVLPIVEDASEQDHDSLAASREKLLCLHDMRTGVMPTSSDIVMQVRSDLIHGLATTAVIITEDSLLAALCDHTIVVQCADTTPRHILRAPTIHPLAYVATGVCVVAVVVGAFLHPWTSHNVTADAQSIPVVQCTVESASGGSSFQPTHLPSRIDVSLPPSSLHLYDAYDDGTFVMIGPANWSCQSTTAGSGDIHMEITPDIYNAGEGVSFTAANGDDAVQYLLCPYLASIRDLGIGNTCVTHPPGEVMSILTPTEEEYVDSPHQVGHGTFSGQGNVDLGVAVWVPNTNKGVGVHTSPSFGFTEDCALPQSLVGECTTIEGYEVGHYSTGQKTPLPAPSVGMARNRRGQVLNATTCAYTIAEGTPT